MERSDSLEYEKEPLAFQRVILQRGPWSESKVEPRISRHPLATMSTDVVDSYLFTYSVNIFEILIRTIGKLKYFTKVYLCLQNLELRSHLLLLSNQ